MKITVNQEKESVNALLGMKSFHNDPTIKEKYLSRVVAHRKADNIIQGTGWGNGRGCAVGCTLENYDHSRYPEELGLPEWIGRLEDTIHENLPDGKYQYWPEEFLKAVPVGVCVENVRHKLAVARMDRLIKIQTDNLAKNPELKEVLLQTISAIEAVKKCHEAESNKAYCDWSEARSEARSAACSASASVVLVASTYSASAAYSARSAAYSSYSASVSLALSAASSAASAAYSAAYSSAWSSPWKEESELLLKLLSECE